MRTRQRLPVQTVQRKQHMTSDDKLRVAITTRGVSRERVVASHVRVNDFDLVFAHVAIQLVRTLHVKRIPQWQCFDLRRRQLHVFDQRRTRTNREVKVVTSFVKTVGQIGNVTFAAAERCR